MKRKKAGKRGVDKKKKNDSGCKVCSLSSLPSCECPGVWDAASGIREPDPKVADRDVYARLRELIDAADRHRAVSEFHWKTTGVDTEGRYNKWQEEASRLEAIL